MEVLCVILHYGDPLLTYNCLESLTKSYPDIDIVVVDNDPNQNFFLKPIFDKYVRVLRTGGTSGFATANNLGVKFALNENHKWIFILNNDTIVTKDAIKQLLKVLEDEKVGAVGPCMPYLDHPGIVWACGGKINKFLVKIGGLKVVKTDQPFEVDYLPGAAILCKRHIWEYVGGLPEKYHLAYEEAEFALKVKRNKLKMMAVPGSIVYHKVGMSSKPAQKKDFYKYNSIRNRLKFGKFIWGKIFGFILALFVTFLRSFQNQKTFKIWLKAISDELKNIPLDKWALEGVKELK